MFLITTAGHADVHGTQQRKHKSLDEGDQQFQATHEEIEDEGDH